MSEDWTRDEDAWREWLRLCDLRKCSLAHRELISQFVDNGCARRAEKRGRVFNDADRANAAANSYPIFEAVYQALKCPDRTWGVRRKKRDPAIPWKIWLKSKNLGRDGKLSIGKLKSSFIRNYADAYIRTLPVREVLLHTPLLDVTIHGKAKDWHHRVAASWIPQEEEIPVFDHSETADELQSLFPAPFERLALLLLVHQVTVAQALRLFEPFLIGRPELWDQLRPDQFKRKLGSMRTEVKKKLTQSVDPLQKHEQLRICGGLLELAGRLRECRKFQPLFQYLDDSGEPK